MKHLRDNVRLYLAWQSGKMSEKQRRQVKAHLACCETCRRYVEALDSLFNDVDLSIFPRLELPHWSPAGAKSCSLQGRVTEIGWSSQLRGIRRLALPALLVAAVFLGMVVGRWIATPLSSQQNTEVLSHYQQLFEQADISSSLAVVLETNDTVEP